MKQKKNTKGPKTSQTTCLGHGDVGWLGGWCRPCPKSSGNIRKVVVKSLQVAVIVCSKNGMQPLLLQLLDVRSVWMGMLNAWKTDRLELRNMLEGTGHGKGAESGERNEERGEMRNIYHRGERLGLSLCAVASPCRI